MFRLLTPNLKSRASGLQAVLGPCLLTVIFAASLAAGGLSQSDKYFLSGYEKMRAALAANDLVGANQAANALTNSGIEVPRSETLERARATFARISDVAVKLASGQPGYYVIYCPMMKRQWVQTSKKIDNPYTGRDMISCGEIKH